MTRFDVKTGKVSYKTRIVSDGTAGNFTTSPWAYKGMVFCLSEEGKTYVVQAGGEFKLLHSNTIEEMAMATPAIVGDRLLLRTRGSRHCARTRSTGVDTIHHRLARPSRGSDGRLRRRKRLGQPKWMLPLLQQAWQQPPLA